MKKFNIPINEETNNVNVNVNFNVNVKDTNKIIKYIVKKDKKLDDITEESNNSDESDDSDESNEDIKIKLKNDKTKIKNRQR